jgi:type IV secretion system protein TrbD
VVTTEAPRHIPIHRALNRPSLILGGEREWVWMAMLLAALIAFTASSWIQVGIGIVFWLSVHAGLVAAAKVDPMMSKVLQRHLRYAAYYPARTGDDAPSPAVPPWED